MAVTYPDTLLQLDQLDQPYGGAPANRFGAPARAFIDAVLRFLSKAYLAYLRVEYATFAAVLQTSCQPGDVIVLDTAQSSVGGFYLRKAATGGLTSTTIVVGVAVETQSALARARVAYAGLLPPTITGLTAGAGGVALTVDGTTGKLRAAAAGEAIYAYVADGQFNVLLLSPGRIL